MCSNADEAASGDEAAPVDRGLLDPVSVGTAGERLTGDDRVLHAMLRAEAALLRALVRTNIAPPHVARAADTVAATTLDPRTVALRAPAGGNPVIPLLHLLRERMDARDAAWVHHGATSQDIVDTALALVTRDVTATIERELLRLARLLVDLAERHRGVPTVARTLTQHALPTTVGMRAANWLTGVHDAIRTVRADTCVPAALGGPVGTTDAYGTHGPAVLDAFAAELGLATPVAAWHTNRAPIERLACALTVTGEACGKIAADVLALAQSEVGEVHEGTGGGSSAMPHKANPTRSVLVTSAARQLPALGSVLGCSAAAEQERPAGAWHAEWQPLLRMLRLTSAAAEHTAELVAGLRFDSAAIAANVDSLCGALGRDRTWVDDTTEPAGVWVDRILRQHREEFG